MKARINLAKFPEGRPGYYAMMEDEVQYERVLNSELGYEKSKRVTHYLVPASVFERLLALDRCREKLVGTWEVVKDEDGTTEVRCSCCKGEAHVKSFVNNEYFYDPFCPRCGADMRSDSDIETEGVNNDPNN